MPPSSCHTNFVPERHTMFDELWSEIADAPGEIFDVIEYKEEWEKDEKFNVESYINSNYDY